MVDDLDLLLNLVIGNYKITYDYTGINIPHYINISNIILPLKFNNNNNNNNKNPNIYNLSLS